MSEALTVGQQLRQEREKKNITLEAVSQVTRISIEQLEALERDDFQVIAAPVFVRGFLRNYAAFLGIDPKEIIVRYDAQVDLFKLPPKLKEAPPSKKNTGLFKYAFFLVAIFIGVAAAYYYFQEPSPPPPASSVPVAPTVAVAPAPVPAPSPTPEPPSPAAEKVIPEKPVPVKPVPEKVLVQPVTPGLPPGKPPEKTASPPPAAKEVAKKAVSEKLVSEKTVSEKGLIPTSAPVPPREKPPEKSASPSPVGKETAKKDDPSKERKHTLKIATREKTWVRIKADDQPASEALLQPKETATWSAQRKLDVTIGNAGGVDLFFNGLSLGVLGKSGEVVVLTLPKEDRPQSPAPKAMKPSEPAVSPPAKPEPAANSAAEVKTSSETASKQQNKGMKENNSKESTPGKNPLSSEPNQKVREKGERKDMP